MNAVDGRFWGFLALCLLSLMLLAGAVLLWWPLRLWGEERSRFGLELRLGRRPA